MKKQLAIIFTLALSPMLLAQEAFKCKTPTGYQYQDRPCKVEAVVKSPSGTAPKPVPTGQALTTDTQDRLERDKKYLADRAYARERTEARERVQYCEQDAFNIQTQIDQTATARLTDYVPNRNGLAQMQLDEERRQSVLAGLQSKVVAKRHECEEYRRALAQFK